MTIPRWLTELAERKLGSGAVVRMVDGEWLAERTVTHVSGLGRTRVTAATRDVLVWFLEQMPDVKTQPSASAGVSVVAGFGVVACLAAFAAASIEERRSICSPLYLNGVFSLLMGEIVTGKVMDWKENLNGVDKSR